ncbi:hypothetical protein, partial [Stenotrophomonas maltophilia]|uniref:hypothetical protein n=1 Tax=Stenotrophomonas maltophilia TaxID=40324 RepID=UPI001B80B0BF
GLDGAIHGANGPADPHRPTSDRFLPLLGGVDPGRHDGSTPCVDESLSGIEKRMESDLFLNGKGLPWEQR